jgi:type IV pilus assembly protein PilW
MNTPRLHRYTVRRHAQRGFTMIELMIAILIGVFLCGGLLTLTSAMRRTSSIQGDLGQLHDTERLSMSLMADVIQSTGFFTFPTPPGTTTVATVFPSGTVGGTTWLAAQTISGTDGGTASAQTDTISVRYTSAGGDGILNCVGGTVAAATSWVAQFKVDGAGDLQCLLTTNGTIAATPITLATGVQYLGVLYGVQTNTAAATFSVDTYLTATQVTAGGFWPNVISVQVTLWFVNPLYCSTTCQAGQQKTQPPTIKMTRTIALMSKAGVNTV